MRIPLRSVPLLLATVLLGAPAAGAATPVGLTLDGPPPPINFGWRPGTQTTDIVLKAARDLPAELSAADVEVEVARPLRRVGDTLVTVPPASVELAVARIAGDRIHVVMSVDGGDLKPGSYAGTVAVAGPGLRPLDVPVQVAVKNAGLFWLGVVLVGVLTLLLLAYKELRAEGKIDFDAWLASAPATVRALPSKAQRRRYLIAPRSRFGVDFWALECVLPLGVAVSAMYAVYATTTAWGADSLTAVFALLSTALAAAGVRSILVTAR